MKFHTSDAITFHILCRVLWNVNGLPVCQSVIILKVIEVSHSLITLLLCVVFKPSLTSSKQCSQCSFVYRRKKFKSFDDVLMNHSIGGARYLFGTDFGPVSVLPDTIKKASSNKLHDQTSSAIRIREFIDIGIFVDS